MPILRRDNRKNITSLVSILTDRAWLTSTETGKQNNISQFCVEEKKLFLILRTLINKVHIYKMKILKNTIVHVQVSNFTYAIYAYMCGV